MNPHKMSRNEFRDWIKVRACSLAMLHYKHNHPGVNDEQAEAHALRFWRKWVDTALEFIAYEQIQEDKRAGRPWY